jgi:DNA-binding NarL/FixJ family response regulator
VAGNLHGPLGPQAPAMTDRPRYIVQLLEDRAGVWMDVKQHLPAESAGAGSSSRVGPREARGGCTIGLVGWISATPAETAVLSSLRQRHEGPIVAVLCEPPAARGARLLAVRLEGVMLLDRLESTLCPTLEAVAVGQRVVPGEIREILDRPPLSPRERQLLAMVVLGFSNAEIASNLYLSESNVKNHLSSAFAKLGVSSRSAAAELILDRESGLGPGILRISPEEPLPGVGEIN